MGRHVRLFLLSALPLLATTAQARVAPDGQHLMRHRSGLQPPNSALSLQVILLSGGLDRAKLTVMDGPTKIPVTWESIQRWPRYGSADHTLLIRPAPPRRLWPAGKELVLTAKVGRRRGVYRIKIGHELDKEPPQIAEVGEPIYYSNTGIVSIPYKGLREKLSPVVKVELELVDPKNRKKRRKAKVTAIPGSPAMFNVNATQRWCLARGRVIDLAGNRRRLPKAPCKR